MLETIQEYLNTRHLQQHTGELCKRLGTEVDIDVDWVGKMLETG